jgi:hypothetical protein
VDDFHLKSGDFFVISLKTPAGTGFSCKKSVFCQKNTPPQTPDNHHLLHLVKINLT